MTFVSFTAAIFDFCNNSNPEVHRGQSLSLPQHLTVLAKLPASQLVFLKGFCMRMKFIIVIPIIASTTGTILVTMHGS